MEGSIWSSVSTLAKDLIRGCLEMDPANRLTSMQALNHGWFQVAWPAWPRVHRTFTVPVTPYVSQHFGIVHILIVLDLDIWIFGQPWCFSMFQMRYLCGFLGMELVCWNRKQQVAAKACVRFVLWRSQRFTEVQNSTALLDAKASALWFSMVASVKKPFRSLQTIQDPFKDPLQIDISVKAQIFLRRSSFVMFCTTFDFHCM